MLRASPKRRLLGGEYSGRRGRGKKGIKDLSLAAFPGGCGDSVCCPVPVALPCPAPKGRPATKVSAAGWQFLVIVREVYRGEPGKKGTFNFFEVFPLGGGCPGSRGCPTGMSSRQTKK